MKKLIVLLLAAAGLFLSGCIVLSVYPFYTSRDVVFDPGLLGKWVETGATNQPDDYYLFEKADAKAGFEKEGTNAYLLTTVETQKTNHCLVHLFKLKGQMFLDLFTAEETGDIMPHPIPSHMVMRVSQMTPTLKMTPMDYEWLSNLIEQDPGALRHHDIKSEGEKDHFYVLTADTAELQRFVLKHLKTEKAWKDAKELKRVPGP
jgi:hypothetical protein